MVGKTLGCFAMRVGERLAGFDVLADLRDDLPQRRALGLLPEDAEALGEREPALIIVENWRAKIVMSLGLMPVPNLISFIDEMLDRPSRRARG